MKQDFEVLSLERGFYLKPDKFIDVWARKCGWQATLVYDSLWRHADRNREAFPSVKGMAEEFGISVRSVNNGIKNLLKFNIISIERKRDDKGTWLRNTYFLLAKKHWRELPDALGACGEPDAPDAINQMHHSTTKDTHTKGTHITLPPIVPPTLKNIDSLTEEDFREISDKYQVPIAFVRSKYDDMVLWAGERPGNSKTRGRNWKLTLMKWVKTDALKLISQPRKGGMIYVES